MEKSKPMELGLGELLSNPNIVNNNSFRFISRDLGVIISFAHKWIVSSLAQGGPIAPKKAESSGY